ncbi:hypothetical protein C8F04DRAFT_1270704 [Mycena alexandri]|uniref:Uncharacterized protein n=1 Tax=Mycena alexandri TaxID=1745969 RepID=A0AAD6SAA1_9AGAR|nr:hypothetical protein C8F04DRAFT_1270704 [Mycena alexandri]
MDFVIAPTGDYVAPSVASVPTTSSSAYAGSPFLMTFVVFYASAAPVSTSCASSHTLLVAPPAALHPSRPCSDPARSRSRASPHTLASSAQANHSAALSTYPRSCSPTEALSGVCPPSATFTPALMRVFLVLAPHETQIPASLWRPESGPCPSSFRLHGGRRVDDATVVPDLASARSALAVREDRTGHTERARPATSYPSDLIRDTHRSWGILQMGSTYPSSSPGPVALATLPLVRQPLYTCVPRPRASPAACEHPSAATTLGTKMRRMPLRVSRYPIDSTCPSVARSSTTRYMRANMPTRWRGRTCSTWETDFDTNRLDLGRDSLTPPTSRMDVCRHDTLTVICILRGHLPNSEATAMKKGGIRRRGYVVPPSQTTTPRLAASLPSSLTPIRSRGSYRAP